jgi:hypothetical protein
MLKGHEHHCCKDFFKEKATPHEAMPQFFCGLAYQIFGLDFRVHGETSTMSNLAIVMMPPLSLS